MEYSPGGDLYYLMHQILRMTEQQAKFYFAELVSAIDFIHSKEILYLDIKVI